MTTQLFLLALFGLSIVFVPSGYSHDDEDDALPYLALKDNPSPEAMIAELESVIHQASLVPAEEDVAVGRDYFIRVFRYALAAFRREQTHVSIEASELERLMETFISALEECGKLVPPSAKLP